MKHALVCAVSLFLIFVVVGQAFSQVIRRPQIELYAGVGIPTAPESFKDYWKVGFSGHGQYVVFLRPNVGVTLGAGYERFTFDEEKVLSDAGIGPGSGVSIDAPVSILEFGIGVRPYLTPAEAPTQIFLFGMGTMNVMKWKMEISWPGGTLIVVPEDDETKMGVAVGAGVEVPAGESINLIVQGVLRIVSSDKLTGGDNLSFLGVTAGLVF
ncbi:MAG: hypothetical protein QME66_12975 [Candidatus Eisenbacteria bacterium]|nr:hypothetical protein [Candidatus Eisenbacteria bacterium]